MFQDLTGVSLEVWGPSTVGVAIAESAVQPPASIASVVLSVVNFLASQPTVEWISTAAVFDTANKHASSISQSGRFEPPSHPLWDRNLTGAGTVVSIGDTGVAWSSCFFNDPDVPVSFGQRTAFIDSVGSSLNEWCVDVGCLLLCVVVWCVQIVWITRIASWSATSPSATRRTTLRMATVLTQQAP